MEQSKEFQLAYSALANVLGTEDLLSGNAVDMSTGTLYSDVKEGLELATKLLLQCASEKSND